MSVAAYRQTIAECEDPRRIEYRVFLRITLELEAQQDGDRRSPDLKRALARNQELWSTLRADLLDDENGLPAPLRAGLVSLAFTVDRQTRGVLRGETSVGLLIDINRAIMKGLQDLPQPALEAVHGP